MKTKVLVSGSMNPFTHGHLFVVEQALEVFDEVCIGIGYNPDKPDIGFMDIETRKALIRDCTATYGERVTIESYTGVTVYFACDIGASAMIRGIRNSTDQGYESNMTFANSLLSQASHGRVMPTLFIPCPPVLMEVSSSRVRELVQLKAPGEVLEHYVPAPVVDHIINEIYQQT